MSQTFALEMKAVLIIAISIIAQATASADDLVFSDISITEDGKALKAVLKNRSDSTTYYSAPELFGIQCKQDGEWIDVPTFGGRDVRFPENDFFEIDPASSKEVGRLLSSFRIPSEGALRLKIITLDPKTMRPTDYLVVSPPFERKSGANKTEISSPTTPRVD